MLDTRSNQPWVGPERRVCVSALLSEGQGETARVRLGGPAGAAQNRRIREEKLRHLVPTPSDFVYARLESRAGPQVADARHLQEPSALAVIRMRAAAATAFSQGGHDGGIPLKPRDRVRVGIERDGDAGVTEAFGDDLHVYPAEQAQRGVRVTQVVTRPLRRWPAWSGGVTWPRHSTGLAGGGEHMRILFIGGTSFVGRHMVTEAVGRGHDVTLFHRGETGRALFPEARHVFGDRARDLPLLAGSTWDAAVDVCAYVPREVRQAADALSRAVGLYCYVSTTDVYRPTGQDTVVESSPLFDEEDLRDPVTEEVTDETYGPLKALCEHEAEAAFSHVIIVRPTYVLGPFDNTDRFPRWVRRGATGGEILAPGPPDAPAQVIDARDLAALTVGLVERGASGPFNGVAPTITFEEMLSECLTAGDGTLTWVDPAFLREQGVDIETELPLWSSPEDYELARCDPSKSIAQGLRLRPLAETVRDTLAWDRERGLPALNDALEAARERGLLKVWRTRVGT